MTAVRTTPPIDPAESHSGEGLASVRPRLARTLADSALRSANKQLDAMTARTLLELGSEPDPTSAPKP